MRYSKHVLDSGTYQTGTGPIAISRGRMKHWCSQFKRMNAAGLRIPVPWGHTSSTPKSRDEQEFWRSKYNAGFVSDLSVDKRGRLMAKLDIPHEDDSKRIGTVVREVSPEVRESFRDGSGRTWKDVITHVALVQLPVAAGQDNFQPAEPEAEIPATAMRLSLGQKLALEFIGPKSGKRRVVANERQLPKKIRESGQLKDTKDKFGKTQSPGEMLIQTQRAKRQRKVGGERKAAAAAKRQAKHISPVEGTGDHSPKEVMKAGSDLKSWVGKVYDTLLQQFEASEGKTEFPGGLGPKVFKAIDNKLQDYEDASVIKLGEALAGEMMGELQETGRELDRDMAISAIKSHIFGMLDDVNVSRTPASGRRRLLKSFNVQMSLGVKKMADDKDLFDDELEDEVIDDAAEDEGLDDLVLEDTGEKLVDDGPDMSALLSKLNEFGLMLPDTTTLDELPALLMVAIDTKMAAEGDNDNAGDEDFGADDLGIEEEGLTEEQVALSHTEQLNANPHFKLMSQQMEDRQRSDYNAEIKGLVDSGRVSPAFAKKYLEPAVGSYKMSLVTVQVDGKDKIQPKKTGLDTRIAMLKDLPAGAMWEPGERAKRMSGDLNAVAQPDEFTSSSGKGDGKLSSKEVDSAVNTLLKRKADTKES